MEITPEIQAIIDAAVTAEKAALIAKNNELIEKNKRLSKNQEIDPQTVIELERQVDKLQSELAASNKSVKDQVKAIETIQKQLETETGFTKKLLIDNGLTDELVKNGIAPQFLAATKAMFSSQAQVVIDGDSRQAKIGDKSLTDFVKEFVSSEEGKYFVSAPANGGGGSHGGSSGQQNDKLTSVQKIAAGLANLT